jgi:hypothetical protein
MANQRRTAGKTARVALRLTERLVTRLLDAAHAEDRTLSEYVREVLRRELLHAQRDDADGETRPGREAAS